MDLNPMIFTTRQLVPVSESNIDQPSPKEKKAIESTHQYARTSLGVQVMEYLVRHGGTGKIIVKTHQYTDNQLCAVIVAYRVEVETPEEA